MLGIFSPMARRRFKDSMTTDERSSENTQSTVIMRYKHRFTLTIIAIALTLGVALYFSLSTSELEPQNDSSDSAKWHEVKHGWNTKSFSKRQMDLVIDSINLSRLKDEILPNFLIVRKPGTENIRKVKNYIVNTLKDIGWTIEEHSFEEAPPASYSKHPVTFTNVIATYNSSAKRRLILACHYDSKVTPEGFIGATDSAVPCAMLIEIAKSLKSILSGSPSDLSLQLLFLDGEEAFVEWTSTDSLYGARNLAQKWEKESWPIGENSDKNTLHSIDLFVLLDLLGEANPNFISKQGVDNHKHYTELTRIEDVFNDGHRYFQKRRLSANVQDDHVPFLQRNVPILHLITLPFPGNWHKMTDNGDNIDFKTVHRLMKIFTVFTAEYLHLDPDSS